jgi:hypothetical protein
MIASTLVPFAWPHRIDFPARRVKSGRTGVHPRANEVAAVRADLAGILEALGRK